jgi:alkylation response protein AidB-like acyl-CoA dehydrogenase
MAESSLVPAARDAEAVAEATRALLTRVDPNAVETAEFLGAQFDAGLAWVQYPVGSGGLDVPASLQRVADELLAAAGAPRAQGRNPLGIGMAAPTIVAYGTEEQRARFLRPLFTGEQRWCQLFSEPGAGSDLAGLATRAIRDGDNWVVTGQKVWTSLGHVARYGMLLARTRPDAPKHSGLTYFLLDMHQPGVTVRPLRQMTGEAEFNEVFLDGAVVPDANRLGAIDGGWSVAGTTLANERVALSGAGTGGANVGGRQIEHLLGFYFGSAQRSGGRDEQVVGLFIDSQLIRWTNTRMRQARRRSAPGAEGSVTKLFQGLFNRRLQELLVDLGADEAAAWTAEDRAAAQRVEGFLRAQANTIEGGTANVLRNVIAERVLGMPREPGLPGDTPWDRIPRN